MLTKQKSLNELRDTGNPGLTFTHVAIEDPPEPKHGTHTPARPHTT